MHDPELWHRLQFAFTIVYHYLFPQLTMGLALLIVVMKVAGLRTGDSRWDDAARFWIRIFGINFAVGVVTGIPMEFQFGTNWAAFSKYAGGVIGQTLAMEGLFAFFLESSFLGLLVFGERRLGRRAHFLAALALFAGSWLSGYFIICTNAFMQHPVGHAVGRRRRALPGRLLGLSAQPVGARAVRAQHDGRGRHRLVRDGGRRRLLRAAGVFIAIRRDGSCASAWSRASCRACSSLFPTGDRQAKLVARHQPVSLAAMEGHFESRRERRHRADRPAQREGKRLDNPIVVPGFLSFLAYGTFHAERCRARSSFPRTPGPTTSSCSTTRSTSWPDSARSSSL